MALSSHRGSGRALSSAKKMGDPLKEKSTWEEFFDAHAPVYEDNVFTKNTIREVDFLIEELSFPPAGSILEVGCGTGRHSIELARRGYSVTEGRSAMNREKYTRLEEIPNVGPSMAEDLRLVGVSHPRDLIGRDPYQMYEELCCKTGERHDPCVIDAFISAVRFMEGEPERPWWAYTSERKNKLDDRDFFSQTR